MIRLQSLGLAELDLDDWTAGWHVTDVDVGFPNVREAVIDRPGQDGTIDRTSNVGARAVTVGVKATAGPSSLRTLLDRLAPFLDVTRRVNLIVVDESGDQRSLAVRSAGDMSTPWQSPTLMELSVGFVSIGRPYFRGNFRSISLAPKAVADGVIPPFTFPLEFPAETGESAGVIRNSGTAPATWTAVVAGPCTDLQIRNDTTGERVDFVGLALQQGQLMHVDSNNRSVAIGGEQRYAAVKHSTSTWWTIPPGETRISMLAGTTSFPANVQFTFADTYLL